MLCIVNFTGKNGVFWHEHFSKIKARGKDMLYLNFVMISFYTYRVTDSSLKFIEPSVILPAI